MARQVERNDERSRYEITVDGDVAGFTELEEMDGAVALTHTVVEDAYEGEGVGGELVRGALEHLRGRGVKVVPLCSFVEGWIGGHDEFADLVDTEALARRRG